jgi:hypothetical protein
MAVAFDQNSKLGGTSRGWLLQDAVIILVLVALAAFVPLLLYAWPESVF